MANDHKDYSGTPLPKKLGIRDGSRVLLVNAPEGFEGLLTPMPDGAQLLKRATKGLDIAVLFATEQAGLIRSFDELASSMETTGRLWVAWPKKASKVTTDIDFEFAQGIGLDAGLVDNKSASITEVFQGLQFVYRVRDRPKR
ncbi:MAG: DUF3052 domain-containing protein [Actinomycetota bacterium]